MQSLHPHCDFVVKENRGLYLVLGLICLAIFIYSLTDKVDFDYTGKFRFKMMYLVAVPAFFFLARALKAGRVIIRINKEGIYYFGELITNWQFFKDATVTQAEKMWTLQDNFILLIHYADAEGKKYRSKIPLTNNQDKSEEEIIAAIKYFRMKYLERQGF